MQLSFYNIQNYATKAINSLPNCMIGSFFKARCWKCDYTDLVKHGLLMSHLNFELLSFVRSTIQKETVVGGFGNNLLKSETLYSFTLPSFFGSI